MCCEAKGSITMLPGHLLRLPAYTALLFLVRHVSAERKQPISNDPHHQGKGAFCPFLVEVGEGHGLARVTLQDYLIFSLNPNLPVMSMEFVGDDVLYKATVDGTMVQLFKCDVHEAQCEMVNEGGSKSNDLLVPNKWNKIYVKYNNGEITVDVNMKASVMGGQVTMSKEPIKSSGVMQVTFIVPPATPSYHATLEIPCSDGMPEIQTELPILSPAPVSTTTTAPQPLAPYKKCPMYRVEMNHPSVPAPVFNNLTLALYPNHPSLHLIIANEIHYFKVEVHGSSVKLLECQVTGQRCEFKDEVKLSIEPKKWNFVTISLQDNKILVNIRVNEGEGNVLMAHMPSTNRKGLTVTAYVPEELQILDARYYSVAYVNVKCEIIEQRTTWPVYTFTTTPKGLPTNAPIVETTTDPSTSPGLSRDLGIVIGVLVAVLIIIALAIIISTVVKKRRSAAISEQSPLQNQFQQQD
ncbi:uncharacterized protein LOC135101609 isoform X1 [Scylla paramamosain]|uniref:uncharacterized protein LOC135101609 isoform X1 n=2 Tax=Scylla paramamosain TaxID=85552 RepID=UPI0030831A21